MLTLTAPGEIFLGTANTTSGAANTFGNWVQVTASLSGDHYLTAMALYDLTAAMISMQAQVGVGAAGSEVVQTMGYVSVSSGTGAPVSGTYYLAAPLLLTNGSRVAVRTSANNATQNIFVSLLGAAAANLTDPTDTTIATNLDATITSRLADADYTAPDNTTIAAIDAKTTNLPADPAATSDIPTAAAIATEVYTQADAIETNWTLRQALRAILASAAAKLSGAPGPSIAIRDVNDTTDRIQATTDANGNRTNVTYNV